MRRARCPRRCAPRPTSSTSRRARSRRFRARRATACIACWSRICARRRIRARCSTRGDGLPRDVPATLSIIGAALDPALGDAARALAAERSARAVCWVPRPHAWTRQAIKRAHLLIVPSRMEGGANVVVEAVTAGTAVIASRISGNVGMLGDDYPGYFDGRRCSRPGGAGRSSVRATARSSRRSTRRVPRARAAVHAGRGAARSLRGCRARSRRATGRMARLSARGSLAMNAPDRAAARLTSF